MISPDTGQNASFYSAGRHRDGGRNTVVVALKSPKRPRRGAVDRNTPTSPKSTPQRDRRRPFGAPEADGSGAVQARRVLLRLQGSRREMARSGAGGVAFENRGPAHLDAVEWVPVLEPSLRAPEIERLGAGDQESAGGRRRAFKSNPDPSSSSPRTVELSSCCQHEADRLEFDKSKCARPFPGHRRAGTCRRSGRRWRAHPGPRLVVVALLEPAVEQFNSTIREHRQPPGGRGWVSPVRRAREERREDGIHRIHVASPIEIQVMSASPPCSRKSAS